MKAKLFLILASVGVAFAVNAQDYIPTIVKQVKVYRQGADVNRIAKFQTSTGRQKVLLAGLSPNIDPNTLRVTGKGKFTLIDVEFKADYVSEKKAEANLEALENEMQLLNRKLAELKAKIEASQLELKFMETNQKVGSDQNGLKANDWQANADFFATRISAIKLKQVGFDFDKEKLNNDIAKVKDQITKAKGYRGTYQGVITAEIDAESAGNAMLDITYYVSNASWYPVYDLRVENTDAPVNLEMKARVQQNALEDWNNVSLVLSTMNPTHGATKPTLYTRYVDFYMPRPVYYGAPASAKRASAPSVNQAEGASMDMEELSVAEPEMQQVVVEMADAVTGLTFEIKSNYDIPNNTKKLVNVRTIQLPASYMYYATPALSTDAFLYARIADAQNYDLLPGETNIYLAGGFVGRTTINPQSVGDTMLIALGSDPSLAITRTPIRDFTKGKVGLKSKEETHIYSISVKNNKKSNVAIEIDDNIPVSRNKEIEVELNATPGAIFHPETGKLVWRLNLKSGEKQDIKSGFILRYPRDKQIRF